MIPVPETLAQAIAKLMEVVSYLEVEDARRAAWEADVEVDLADLGDQIAAIDSRVYALEMEKE